MVYHSIITNWRARLGSSFSPLVTSLRPSVSVHTSTSKNPALDVSPTCEFFPAKSSISNMSVLPADRASVPGHPSLVQSDSLFLPRPSFLIEFLSPSGKAYDKLVVGIATFRFSKDPSKNASPESFSLSAPQTRRTFQMCLNCQVAKSIPPITVSSPPSPVNNLKKADIMSRASLGN